MKAIILTICFVIWGGDMVTHDPPNPVVPIAAMIFIAGVIDNAVADITNGEQANVSK